MERLGLQAERRYVLGKSVRFLRREGIVPANLYGLGLESVALQVPAKDMEQLLGGMDGAALVQLTLDNEPARTVLIKDVQRDPVWGELLHVDLQQVAETERVRVEIPLQLVGEAPAVKTENGTLLQSRSIVTIHALPRDLPSHLEADVSSLVDFNAAIFVRDVPLPSGVEIFDDPDELVAKVAPPKLAVAEEEEAAEVEAAEVAEAAEATAAGEEAEAQAGEQEQPED